jgi:CubicO group peptidase (beta-lactamase class C family)
MIALIDRSAFYFGPGESWRYSNSGYYLLGVVIERAANQPFAQYVRDAFERPLALTQTSYCGESAPPPSGYLTTQPGNAGAAPTPPLDMTLLYSAGALCSTARDLLRWNGALAHGQAVAPQSYARMSSDVRLSDGTLLPYGYALALDPLDGHRRVWHNGLVPGFQSHLAWFPDEDLTVVVLLNLTTETDNASAIDDEVARAMFR